jgi:hypothetical protein
VAISEQNLVFALRNVARHGDTDVFPYPLENHWFHDAETDLAGLLERLDQRFDDWLGAYPVTFVKSLSNVGFNGFRAATQIDPLWNAYFLALVLEVSPDLEAERLAPDRGQVFSYRFLPSVERYTLFDPAMGWAQFHRAALERAPAHEYIVSTDISDFYARIYHHRLENALMQATTKADLIKRVMELLKRLSGGTSYGLPVGGNAARLLAEILLNRTDRLLRSARIAFCRFVHDYFLFAESLEAAQSALVQLSEILLSNEGLTLSRAKTRIMSRSEFVRLSPLADPVAAESEDEATARQFLSLRLAYDPYSPLADEQYELLRSELERFDIMAMLARELRKSRVDEALTRQLVRSIRFLQPAVRDGAVQSVIRNLNILYPIFPTAAILLRQLMPDLSDEVRQEVFDVLRELIQSGSHILLVPTNLSFAIRTLALDRAEETDALLIEVFHRAKADMMVKRDVLLAMTRRRVDYWLSDQLKRFSVVSPWEQRALIVASYVLGDEGRHWRSRIRKELHEADQVFMKWVGTKNSGRVWEVPL